ncbi:Dyp-type peroxidase [Sphaerisporangium corydalis]|uniref:Dyp-type peroxidase n=1 Tax=Sphaerisporangium corydalis TaxID=1441875 RepID=A0ABV9ERT9_9ACTN|nr:Dyp-type peroxidase [Sphaerisporangium corydalis]
MRTSPDPLLSRRGLLAGGAAAAAGALAACAPEPVSVAAPAGPSGSSGPSGLIGPGGQDVEAFDGPHQAGVATLPQAHAVFAGLDLRPGTGREAIGRLMRLLTDDTRRLASGRAALADVETEMAVLPARLTVTFGFGPGLFTAAGLDRLRPESVAPLPAFTIDRLEERWSGGDLVAQICADDPMTVAHALRVIIRDARAFTTVRWTQRGFRRAAHVQAAGTTQRNLMGQLDGTVNPEPGSPDFDRAVWTRDGPSWMRGGTTLVVRRVRMELETWDAADRAGREFSVGRRLSDGAPLTGNAEHDVPDLDRLNAAGLPVISEFAHVRRAHVADPGMRILRRVYNYDEGPTSRGKADSGLVLAAYQADVARQFVPIQRRLAEADLLNDWTTPIGSAVFAVPPGCSSDGWIGDTLLS